MDPPHNRFKAPFYALCGTIGATLAVLWAIRGWWVLAILEVAYAVVCGFAVRRARSSRNPRWFRSFLDR